MSQDFYGSSDEPNSNDSAVAVTALRSLGPVLGTGYVPRGNPAPWRGAPVRSVGDGRLELVVGLVPTELGEDLLGRRGKDRSGEHRQEGAGAGDDL